MRARSAAWRCISARARLRRGAVTRVAAYSSKLLRKVPRWRRSKVRTAGSSVTPANALSITLRETPAAAASRAMPERKVLKSPPHGAAPAGATHSRLYKGSARNRNRILPPFSPEARARDVTHQGLGEAAVDHDFLPGDVAGAFAREDHHHVGDVGGAPPPPQRHHLLAPLEHARRLIEVFAHGPAHEAGAHCVAAHAARAPFERDLAREHRDARLAYAVG